MPAPVHPPEEFCLPAYPLGPHPGFRWWASASARAEWVGNSLRDDWGRLNGSVVLSEVAGDPTLVLLQWVLEKYHLLSLGTYPIGPRKGWSFQAALAEVSRTVRREFGVELGHVSVYRHSSAEPSEEERLLPWRNADLGDAAWLLTRGDPEASALWRRRLERWRVWQAVRLDVSPSRVNLTLYGLWRLSRVPGSPDIAFAVRQASGAWKHVETPDDSWPTWNLVGNKKWWPNHAHEIGDALVALAGYPWDCRFTKTWWGHEAADAFAPRRRQGSFLGSKAIHAIKKALWAHFVDKEVLSLAIGVHAVGRPELSWKQYLEALRHRRALATVATAHRNRLPLLRLLPPETWSSPDVFRPADWAPRFVGSSKGPVLPEDPEARAGRFLDWPVSALQIAAGVIQNAGCAPASNHAVGLLASLDATDWPSLPVFARLEVLRAWVKSNHESAWYQRYVWSTENFLRWLSALARSWCDVSFADRGPTRRTRADLAQGLRLAKYPDAPATHLAPSNAWRHLAGDHPWCALLRSNAERAALEGVLPMVAPSGCSPRARRL